MIREEKLRQLIIAIVISLPLSVGAALYVIFGGDFNQSPNIASAFWGYLLFLVIQTLFTAIILRILEIITDWVTD